MVKRSIPKVVKPPEVVLKTSGVKTSGQAHTISDIDEMEKTTMQKANQALSAIENAIAVWDASKDKPEDLKLRMGRLKYFYEALTGWEKKMLKSMARKEEAQSRIEHLREFSDICHAYS